MSRLPTDSTERKHTPLCTGCLDYAPAALTEIAYTTGDPCYENRFLDYLRDRELGRLASTAIAILQRELIGGNVEFPAVADLGEYMTMFAEALAAVAQVSWYGNEKHNPGQELHHARGKSADHFDCIARHYVERGGFDGELHHTACLAWRCLIALQEDLEAKGAPLARGARLPAEVTK
jgi:hypothetical protein